MNTLTQPTTGWGHSAGIDQLIVGPDPQIVRFATLFRGRWDAVGGDDGRAIYKPYTYDAVQRHLEGIEPIGTYPTYPDTDGSRWTFWGCCDIDTGEWAEAFQLATALGGMGLKPHVERSRSKGWHVWVFVDTPVQAWEMRRCLKVAYAAIDLPAKEANPKSEVLAPAQLGNYVRLPYNGAAAPFRQCMMEAWTSRHDGTPIDFYDWINRKHDHYSNPDLVRYWASKWFEKPRKTLDLPEYDKARLGPLVARLDASWQKFYETGEVRDRSAAFVALAHWCAKRGWSAADTFTLLWGCPWNKYVDRVDGDMYVRDIVERAYS